jgi:hypothetical protein
MEPPALFEKVKAATVMILTGEGAGRLHSIGTGVLVSRDGVVLTALHVIKNAAEVQVRSAGGEVFDNVELLGSDERRDVAALKLSAVSLPALSAGDSAKVRQGDRIYAVTNAEGLSWSATEGIISAIRPAEEVPGAGSGFRLLQFTAAVAPGSSGGALVDESGLLIGIITGGKERATFAIPVESVLGLSGSSNHIPLGSGLSLQLPRQEMPETLQSSSTVVNANPQRTLQTARTLYIQSKTAFLTVDTLDRELASQKDWAKLGITIVQDPRVADLLVEIDRPLFTYVHTFVIIDKRTSAILTSGKVTAFDGTIASKGIAKSVVKSLSTARNRPAGQ